MSAVQQAEPNNDPDGIEVISVGPATPEEIFWASVGDEITKRNITTLNELLRLMVTLSSGLLGGAVIFRERLTNGWLACAGFLAVFISLAAGLAGLLFCQDNFCRYAPYEVRESYYWAMKYKDRWLLTSAVALFAGLGAGLLLLMVGK